MQTWEFENLLKRLSSYYDKKDGANKDRNQLHFQKIKFIPGGEVLNGIYHQITDEFEYFPRNLPKALKTAWDTWKARNPEKIRQMVQRHTGCKHCEKGNIYFTVYEPNQPGKPDLKYKYIAPCGHCRQDFTAEPKLTVYEIKKRGGILDYELQN